ncbi:MAG: MATE family efflux transporter [Desulfovibrionaceae bacterium]
MSISLPPIAARTSPGAIWRLTWPQMLMMYLHFCIGFTDVWVAGQLGASVQAAFGVVMQCVIFLMLVANALSSGGVAAVSQSIGAGRHRRARRYIYMIVMGCCGIGIGISLLGHALQGGLFTLLMVPETILPITREYWSVSLLTLPANYVFICTGVMFRATRHVFPPLGVTALVALTNLVGDLGFGLGYFGLPNYGYMGIAWTTFGCVLLGALTNCLLLSRLGYLARIDLPPWRWARRAMRYLFKVALPAGASQIVWNTGYLMLFAIVASLPMDSVSALAGLTAGMRVESLIFLPAMAFNMTASVLVGNMLGARNKAEAQRLALIISGSGCLFISVFALCLWPFVTDIAALLSSDPAAQIQTLSYLRFNLVSTPFTTASMILGGVMTGAGATRYNLMIYGSSFWLVRLPLAWLFGHILWQDASGVFMAMLVSQVVQSLIMFYVVLKRDWTRFAMHSQCSPLPTKGTHHA